MDQLKKVDPTTAKSSAPNATGAKDGSKGSGQLKDSLRGLDFAEQEKLMAPKDGAEEVQSPKGFFATIYDYFFGKSDQSSTKKAPDPLGSGLVLSRDPTYASPDYLDWFTQKAVGQIEPWGFKVPTGAVRIAIDGDKPVVALDWDTSWGARPTGEIDRTMKSIDASVALQAVHALPGWPKVPGTDQPLLNALLGGPTNAVSQAGRTNLRGKFAGLASRTDVEQASTLTGLLGAKDSAPSVVAEDVETTPVTVTLTGPTVEKDYAFRGGKADAEVWDAAYSDGSKLKIVAPKAPDKALHQHTVQEAADAATYLPTKNRAAINTVVLNSVENPDDAHWAVAYKTPDFHSYMTAGKSGVVTIYPNAKKAQPNTNYMRGTMIHETGHTWSYKTWGTDTKKGKWVEWQTAMTNDKNTVSQYAQASIDEDVAETIQVYGSTKGKPKYDEYKALVPNRFAILEKEL